MKTETTDPQQNGSLIYLLALAAGLAVANIYYNQPVLGLIAGELKGGDHALKYFDIARADDELLYFIGPPLKDSFGKLFGGDAAKADLAVQKYREYYSVTGIFENALYDGVADMRVTMGVFTSTSWPVRITRPSLARTSRALIKVASLST